jgi:DNA-binding response OmpR family regulator
VLRAGPLELNRANCQVRRAGKPIALTKTEFKLLEILLSRPGAVFSREQLLEAVWGPGRAVTARTVDVCILRLRRKVESGPGAPAFIRSIRGLGYSFAYAPEQAAD